MDVRGRIQRMADNIRVILVGLEVAKVYSLGLVDWYELFEREKIF